MCACVCVVLVLSCVALRPFWFCLLYFNLILMSSGCYRSLSIPPHGVDWYSASDCAVAGDTHLLFYHMALWFGYYLRLMHICNTYRIIMWFVIEN